MSSQILGVLEQNVPDIFIYEMDEGQPIYYRGYQQVLNKTKTIEEIMGSSALQSLLIMLITDFLGAHLPKSYIRLASELGFKFKNKSWRSLDIAIFNLNKVGDKSIFITNKYIEVPPEIVIEIDTKANLSDLPDPTSYFTKKTDQLLNHGVSKVIWIFTNNRKILEAEKGVPWTIDNWSKDIRIMEAIPVMNIEEIIANF